MPIKMTKPNNSALDKKKLKKQLKGLSDDDYDVLMTINKLKTDLFHLYQLLDYVTEPTLIDSYIYEIKALHMKYQFYLQLCKERQITFYQEELYV